MTVITLGRRGDFAFLATDAGEFGRGGTIRRLQRKLLPLPRLNALIAIAGVGGRQVRAELETFAGDFTEPRAFVEALPAYADAARERYQGPRARFAMADAARVSTFYVALFDKALGSPLCITVLPSDGNARGSAPFTARACSTGFLPSAPIERWPGDSFDPLVDSAELAQVFRATPTPDGMIGAAGWFDLGTVSADGITISTVARWPDSKGKKPGELGLAKRIGRALLAGPQPCL